MDDTISFAVEPLDRGDRVRVTAPLRFAETIDRWQHDARFVDAFVHELRSCAFPAFFFETPVLTRDSLERALEFVLVDAPPLARIRADARSFRGQLDPRQPVSSFVNLGRDALLIAPGESCQADCAHLASFSRTAAPALQRALWRAAAEGLLAELHDGPRWLSSSGLGVPWLHLRIDTRPKYYSHAPYRDMQP